MDYTPEHLRGLVHPILEPVFDSLEEGVAAVPSVHDLLRIAPDPWFDAHIVRRVARSRLEQSAPKNGVPWNLDQTIPNSGIHLVVGTATLRVCRGDIYTVPSPGRNEARRRFWHQPTRNFIQQHLWQEAEDEPDPPHLLLLWRETDAGDVQLSIAVPDGPWEFGGEARLQAVVSLDDQLEASWDAFSGDNGEAALVTRPEPEETPGELS